MICIANLIDTCCFSSTKTVLSDKEWTISVCDNNGIDYQSLYNDSLCLTDVDDLNIASVHGIKYYNYYGINICSSYIQVTAIDNNTLSVIIDL